MFICKRAFRFSALFFLVSSSVAGATALDDYVALEDSSYGWTIASTQTFSPGGTIYNLDLTSQTWRSPADVNRSVWQHKLNIAVPQNSVSDLALLIVEGGSNTSPILDISEYAFISSLVGCTVALLQTVPNQPLRFYNPSTGPLSEDNAIAHTYNKYLSAFIEGQPHPDPTWPLLLPMVKSAVKAMNAIQECLAEQASMNITRFIVGGASKRGWTTWLTAAVDDRVVGIVPVVIDILDMNRQIDHHKNAYSSYPATSSTYYMYGGYSTAIRPYTERQVFDRLNTPGGESLQSIVDPYYYRDRLTMPKLIVNSTGDQFFLPDGIKFYFNQLPGKNYLYYVPNSDHSLGIDGSDLTMLFGLFNFVRSFYPGGAPMPKYSWSFERDGSIRVAIQTEPAGVFLWQAHNPTHRDFRLRTMGPIWQSSALTTRDESGAYIASVPEPETGWTGFYVQIYFEDGNNLCSGLRVLPDTYANDAEPPDVFGPEFSLVSISPNVARADITVEIMVEATEDLSGPPTLTVNNVAATYQSQQGGAHLFAYTVGDSDVNGQAVIACQGKDLFDNPGASQFSSGLTIDTIPPEINNLSILPTFARPGDMVILQFNVSEALLSNPLVTVNGRNASPLVEKDMAYTYTYTVDKMDIPGYANVEIVLVDLAENSVHSQYVDALEIGLALPLNGKWILLALITILMIYHSSSILKNNKLS